MKKILVAFALLVSTFYQLNGQFTGEKYTLSHFLHELHNDPTTVYAGMLEGSTKMNDVVSAIGVAKDQELAFLFQLLPDASKPASRAKFEKTFGKNPDDVVPLYAAYQIYGFVVARTKLPQDPIEREHVLNILAELWAALPSKTKDQNDARNIMRAGFKELFGKDPQDIVEKLHVN